MLLCFVVASTFWLLNALNKNYNNIRVTYPIRLLYNQQEYIPLKPLPEEIAINVNGKGWKLLRRYLMLDVRPADIPVQGFIGQEAVPANAFRPNISNVLDGLQLNFIMTDSLRFKFDRQIKRRIPLVLDSTHLVINADYALVKPITITPGEVEFEGPASILDSLPDPFLLTIPKKPLTGPFKSYVPIDYPYKELVKSDIVEAEIAFDVKPLIWQNLVLPPTLVNKPEDKNYALQPAAVTLKYGFIPGQAPAIDPAQFYLIVNLARVNPKDSTVMVELKQKPAAVHRAVVRPLQVKVIHTTP